jgi:hypothetical protein
VAVSSPVAGVSEVHEMKMDGDVMKMRAVAGRSGPARRQGGGTQARWLPRHADGPEGAAAKGHHIASDPGVQGRQGRGNQDGAHRARGHGRTGRQAGGHARHGPQQAQDVSAHVPMTLTLHRTPLRRPWAVWLAVLVVLLGALAPTLTHALMLPRGRCRRGLKFVPAKAPAGWSLMLPLRQTIPLRCPGPPQRPRIARFACKPLTVAQHPTIRCLPLSWFSAGRGRHWSGRLFSTQQPTPLRHRHAGRRTSSELLNS